MSIKILIVCLVCFSAIISSCAPVFQNNLTGDQALDFELTAVTGETVSLSGFKGQPVVVNFWALSCPYCLDEMPYLQAIYDKYSNNQPKLMVLAINIGDSSTNITKYLTGNDLDLPVLLDRNGEVAQQYGVTGIPVTIFIDKDGIITGRVIGAFRNLSDLENRLSSILN